MITRTIVLLGLLLASQASFAVDDGIFRTRTPELVLEAKIWTEENTSGSQQFMTVRQIEPIIKEGPPEYLLVPDQIDPGIKFGFSRGFLVLPDERNKHVHGHQFFVTYREPMTKTPLLELKTLDGEVVILRRVFENEQ